MRQYGSSPGLPSEVNEAVVIWDTLADALPGEGIFPTLSFVGFVDGFW